MAVLTNGLGVGTAVIGLGPTTQLSVWPTAREVDSKHIVLLGSVTLTPFNAVSPSFETVN